MKNKLSPKFFHSKVLLFGEHVINKGAMGLAIPFEHYDGILKLNGDVSDKNILQSNDSLQKIANYIIHQPKLDPVYDTNQLLEDIENGLYFDSDIPQGYGLGSSGALVAALYEQYRKNKKKNTGITELKEELAEVESYFHGKSSGLDPLVCYLGKAVLINNGEASEAFDLPESEKPQLRLFLVNTHIERKTSPYVKQFLKKCEQKKFMDTVAKSLIPANNIAIESFLQKKHSQLMNSVKLISQLHYDLLPEFIPEKFKEAWRQGLKHNEYHFKICGAGGGGFIIGIARVGTNLSPMLGGLDIIELMKL